MLSENPIARACRYVSQDLKDDFWPDIIDYRDILFNYKTVPRKIVPKDIIAIDIPKPNLILRPGHYINIEDRIYFQYIINKFASKVDRRLQPPSVVMGFRVNHRKSKYFLQDNINNWVNLNAEIDKYFEANENCLLLKTDINAFFEHILIDELIKKLNLFKVDTKKLEILLKVWSPNNLGLPQGNHCSSFLANVYLNEVDVMMTRAGFKYFRFMDDLKIFVKNITEARSAMKELTSLLRPLNLHLNSGKTGLYSKNEYFKGRNKYQAQMEAVEYGMNFKDDDLTAVDRNLKIIWNATVRTKEIDKTKFGFCVNRFAKLGSNFPKNRMLRNNFYDPAYSQVVCNYLTKYIHEKRVQEKAVEVYNNSIYEWQRISILKMFLKADRLKIPFYFLKISNLYQTNNFMEQGYLINYIFKFGDSAEVTKVIKYFHDFLKPDQNVTRYYLIACKYLPDNLRDSEIQQIIKINRKFINLVSFMFDDSYVDHLLKKQQMQLQMSI